MTLSRAELDAPLAQHFGKGKWLLVVEEPVRMEVVRNEGLNGRWVAEALAGMGCTDVIVGGMGAGAYGHARAAGLRLWRGEPGQPARALVEALREGRLRPFGADDLDHGHRHHEHGERGPGHTLH